jgi:hypothetical protein
VFFPNKKWWSEIKTICGFNVKHKDDFSSVVINDEVLSNQSIADLVNDSLVALTDKVPELNKDVLAIMAYTLGQCPDQYIVSEYDVYTVLSKLNMHKATLFDCIDNSLLRVLAPDLAAPICSLINSSIRQGFVPRQWKLSRITLVPKVNQVKDLKRNVRPISITCPISKVAECFIDRFVEEHFYDSLDLNQFGNTKGRSTLTALILLTHTLFNYSDDSHNFVRVLFVDFSRAFELIDHTVLFYFLFYLVF